MLQSGLLYAAILLALVKVAATIWLVRQPDLVTVTDTAFGHMIYLAGKISPALFVSVVLARAALQHAPTGFIVFCAIALVIAVAMAAIVVRKRRRAEWYGYAHEIRQRRQQRR